MRLVRCRELPSDSFAVRSVRNILPPVETEYQQHIVGYGNVSSTLNGFSLRTTVPGSEVTIWELCRICGGPRRFGVLEILDVAGLYKSHWAENDV